MSCLATSRIINYAFFVFLLLGITACSIRKPATRPPHDVVQTARPSLWILVDTKHDALFVYRSNQIELAINNIAWGAAGAGQKVRQGDNITPVGTYRVEAVRRSSKFEYFIDINYPSTADAQRGLERGVIKQSAYDRILRAHSSGKMPPQDTALGGLLGIHGVGKGSLMIHRMANWTGGCVAVENDQIRQIVKLVRPGTIVEIQ